MNDEQSPLERMNDMVTRTNKDVGYTPPPIRQESAAAPEAWKTEPKVTEDPMQKKKRQWRMRAITGALIFLAVCGGIFAYVYIRGLNSISPTKIQVQIDGPATIKAGSDFSYTAHITNYNDSDLQDIIVRAVYPEEFRKAGDRLTHLPSESQTKGVLSRGGGKIDATFNTLLFGEVKSEHTVTLKIEYGVTGSTSRFTKDVPYTITIDSSPVDISVSMPTEINPDQVVKVEVKVRSNSDTTIPNVALYAVYPFGFELQSASPAASQDNTVWLLGALAPGESRTIDITGRARGVENDERTVKFSIGYGDEAANLNRAILAQQQISYQFKASFLAVDARINDSSETTVVSSLGDTLNLRLNLTNNLDTTLSDVKVKVTFIGSAPFDSTAIQASGGSYSAGTITWDRFSTTELKAIEAGRSVSLNLAVPLWRKSDPRVNSLTDQKISIAISAEGTPLAGGSVAGLVRSDVERNVILSSDFAISAIGKVNGGIANNPGPYPFTANAPTTATVTFSLSNTLNSMDKVEVRATLGPRVTWASQFSPSSANIRYDEINRELIWSVGKLAAQSGVISSPVSASVALTVLPTDTDVGQDLTLLTNIRATALDTQTNKVNESHNQDITSKLTSDVLYVFGSEKVVK